MSKAASWAGEAKTDSFKWNDQIKHCIQERGDASSAIDLSNVHGFISGVQHVNLMETGRLCIHTKLKDVSTVVGLI